jgi:hypothetical protein
MVKAMAAVLEVSKQEEVDLTGAAFMVALKRLI